MDLKSPDFVTFCSKSPCRSLAQVEPLNPLGLPKVSFIWRVLVVFFCFQWISKGHFILRHIFLNFVCGDFKHHHQSLGEQTNHVGVLEAFR